MTARPLALVTGASSGIGLELARRFAANGFSLLLAADEPRILAVASDLGDAEAVVTDLSSAAGVEALYAALRGRPVDVLALNAGIVAAGAFATDGDLDRELALVDLNVRSTVHLAKLVVGDMAARGRGRVLFSSSIAAGMPGPYQSTYNASKSFVQSFGLALRDELRDTGVTVTLLMPGPTDTPIFARAGMLTTRLGATRHKDDPADVARDAYDALMEGRERVVAHAFAAKAVAAAGRLLPDTAKAALNRLASRPRSAGSDARQT
jgi:short-subunit dehydrogenase